jgi:hypothetical protein
MTIKKPHEYYSEFDYSFVPNSKVVIFKINKNDIEFKIDFNDVSNMDLTCFYESLENDDIINLNLDPSKSCDNYIEYNKDESNITFSQNNLHMTIKYDDNMIFDIIHDVTLDLLAKM